MGHWAVYYKSFNLCSVGADTVGQTAQTFHLVHNAEQLNCFEIYSRVELTMCRVDLCRVDFLVNESTRHMCRVDRKSATQHEHYNPSRIRNIKTTTKTTISQQYTSFVFPFDKTRSMDVMSVDRENMQWLFQSSPTGWLMYGVCWEFFLLWLQCFNAAKFIHLTIPE